MIVLDTGGLYAALDANERLHGRAVAALVAAAPPRIVSPFVLAELDNLIGTRVGHVAQMALLDEIARGVYSLISSPPTTWRTRGASWSVTETLRSAWPTHRLLFSQTATER